MEKPIFTTQERALLESTITRIFERLMGLLAVFLRTEKVYFYLKSEDENMSWIQEKIDLLVLSLKNWREGRRAEAALAVNAIICELEKANILASWPNSRVSLIKEAQRAVDRYVFPAKA